MKKTKRANKEKLKVEDKVLLTSARDGRWTGWNYLEFAIK